MIWICEPPVSSYFQLQQSCMCFVVFFSNPSFPPLRLRCSSHFKASFIPAVFDPLLGVCTLDLYSRCFCLSLSFCWFLCPQILPPPLASSLPLFSVHTRSDPEALECCWLVAATPKQTLVPQPAVWATIRYCSNRSQCVCVCAWLHAFIAFN